MSQNEDKKIDEIVSLLDNMFSQGNGKVNLKVENVDGEIQVKTTKSSDCNGQSACCQPTELND
ncbi:MAG: hypothetical protein R3Y33_01545 [Clostridia bacterium]